MLDKPYLLLGDINKGDLKIGENTGFNVRGYIFGWREQIVKSSKKPMTVVTIGDESGGVQDVLYFGDQALGVRNKNLDIGDAVFIKNAQLRFDKNNSANWSLQVSGPFAETLKINPAEKGLPEVKTFPTSPLKDLKVDVTAIIKATVWSTDQNPYAGCPRCKRKFKENVPFGKNAECGGNPEKNIPGCGIVQSTKLTWTTLNLTDNDGEAKLRFGPDFPFTDEQLAAVMMKDVIAVGTLNDRDDFEVSWFSPIDALGTAPNLPTVTATPSNINTSVSVTSTPSATVTVTATPATTPSATPTTPKINIPTTILSYLRFFGAKKTEELMELVTKKGASQGDVEVVLMQLLEEKKITKDDATGLVRLA